MKTVGVITEFNPFHNGHEYFLRKAKEITGADYAVAIMSGDFVQRGVPAIFDKYKRTRAALANSADLVLELPTIFATASAESFARGAVSILNSLGVVDYLCFGCETDDFPILTKAASILTKEPASFQEQLKEDLANGLSYPVARSNALCACMEEEDKDHLSSVFAAPNNILALEYLKSLKVLDSQIIPMPILRQGTGFHSEELIPPFASATALRKVICNHTNTVCTATILSNATPFLEQTALQALDSFIPTSALDAFGIDETINSCTPVFDDALSLPLHYRLLSLVNEGADLTAFYDVSSTLANRIFNRLPEYKSYSQFANLCKTKESTQAAINRGLLHILLNIKKSDLEIAYSQKHYPYVRMLGCKIEATSLLSEIKKAASLEFIAKPSQAPSVLNEEQLRLWNLDIHCAHVYQSLLTNVYGTEFVHEYRREVCGLSGRLQ